MSALWWWLIPIVLLVVASAVIALVSYFRLPTEDHDLGQFASLQKAMSRTQLGVRRMKKFPASAQTRPAGAGTRKSPRDRSST